MLEETLGSAGDEATLVASLEAHEKLQGLLSKYDELVARAQSGGAAAGGRRQGGAAAQQQHPASPVRSPMAAGAVLCGC